MLDAVELVVVVEVVVVMEALKWVICNDRKESGVVVVRVARV